MLSDKLQPSFAKPSGNPLLMPLPDPAPVITATLPFSFIVSPPVSPALMICHASFTRIIIDELDRILAYIFSLVNIYFDQIIIYLENKLYYMSYFLPLSI